MSISDSDIQFLVRGSACFNVGLYWEAHEEWEHAWRKLQGTEKAWLQSYILAAGAFFLLQKGRFSPAQRLAQLYFRRCEEGCESWLAKSLRCERLDEVMDLVLRMEPIAGNHRSQEILKSARHLRISHRV